MNRYSEAFESWATKAGYATQRDYTGGYVSPLTQCAWRAWQAGGTKMQEEIAALRVIARSAAQEEETKLDENQFITQQSRIVKLAALREAGYLKEEG